MKQEEIEHIMDKTKEMKMDGVTTEMIISANAEVHNNLCRPLKIIDKLEYSLEMVHITLVKYNFVVGKIIANSQLDTEALELPLLKDVEMEAVLVPLKNAFVSDEDYLSPHMWTCKCDHNYVRSRIVPHCEGCGCTIWNSKPRLKPLHELMNRIRANFKETGN